MTTLRVQARAEAEKAFPAIFDDADDLAYPRSALREFKRGAYARGFLAGHEAATRTRVVPTVDELAAMPHDYETIVRGNDGQVWQRSRNAWDCLSEDGTGGLRPSSAIALPARVLYEPEETR